MMKKILAIVLRTLMICVALFVIFTIILIGTVYYQVTDRTVGNDDQHVRFVLDWFGLDDDYEVKIEHSYKSAGSWSGDWTKSFAIKLGKIEESEIIKMDGVIRGDKVTQLIRDEMEMVLRFVNHGKMTWFPKNEQILSSGFYIFPVSMVLNDRFGGTKHIMLIRPVDKMVYYYCYNN